MENIVDFSVKVTIRKRAVAEMSAPIVERIWAPYLSAKIPLKGATTNMTRGKEVITIPAFSVVNPRC
ncbi:hypothetical protein JCM16816_08760 [Thermoanaerobacter brockii subsp. lactiethylicus]